MAINKKASPRNRSARWVGNFFDHNNTEKRTSNDAMAMDMPVRIIFTEKKMNPNETKRIIYG